MHPDLGPILALTRIRFRHALQMFVAWRAFRSMYRDARRVRGLMRGDVAIVGPRTLVNVSVWKDRASMLAWTGSSAHVRAVQSTYGRTVELWSTEWVIVSQRKSATSWQGMFVVGAQLAHPDESAGAGT